MLYLLPPRIRNLLERPSPGMFFLPSFLLTENTHSDQCKNIRSWCYLGYLAPPLTTSMARALSMVGSVSDSRFQYNDVLARTAHGRVPSLPIIDFSCFRAKG